MNKVLSNILLGIVLLSQAHLGQHLWMKNVCVNGYEFVITYVGNYDDGIIMSIEGDIEVNQVYENGSTRYGHKPLPKKCGKE